MELCRSVGGAASECGWTSDLRRSVGWSYVSLLSVHGGGATSLYCQCVGVELKGFIAVVLSWNWNWRACKAEGCEF